MSKVTFIVGSERFELDKSLILKFPQSLFAKSCEITDLIYIDRSQAHFNLVIEYIKTGQWPTDSADFEKEAIFYGLTTKSCQSHTFLSTHKRWMPLLPNQMVVKCKACNKKFRIIKKKYDPINFEHVEIFCNQPLHMYKFNKKYSQECKYCVKRVVCKQCRVCLKLSKKHYALFRRRLFVL